MMGLPEYSKCQYIQDELINKLFLKKLKHIAKQSLTGISRSGQALFI